MSERLPARVGGRLALRLVGIGVAQLALLALAAVAVETITRPAHLPREGPTAALEECARALEPVALDPVARSRVLTELSERVSLDLSLYDADDSLLASTVSPPLALDAAHPTRTGSTLSPERSSHHPPPDATFARRIPSTRGELQLVASARRPLPRFVGGLATLLVGLLILGIGALYTARSIVGPLERLARAAERLGAGELGARTNLVRGDELGDVARAFDRMAGDIDALLAAERELLANVSHELRTPLARIRVAMDLANEGDSTRAKAAVAEIATDLAELEGLIDDILVAMRLEAEGRRDASAGLPLSTMEQTTTESIADRAIERFRARHPDRPLELGRADELPPILVDKVLFRRVLDNVLENADKYSPDRASKITFHVDADEEHVRFRVADHGLGIRAEDLPNVFKPFFRGERSRSREAGGVGLGLTLAKRIVEAHGGTISVESTAGSGTIVEVRVPAWRG